MSVWFFNSSFLYSKILNNYLYDWIGNTLQKYIPDVYEWGKILKTE